MIDTGTAAGGRTRTAGREHIITRCATSWCSRANRGCRRHRYTSTAGRTRFFTPRTRLVDTGTAAGGRTRTAGGEHIITRRTSRTGRSLASGVRGRGRDGGVTGSIVTHGPASLSSHGLTTWRGGATALTESKSARRTFRSVCGTYSDGLGRRLVAVPLAVVGRRTGLLLRAGFTAGHGDTSTVGPRPITARRAFRSVTACVSTSPLVLTVTTRVATNLIVLTLSASHHLYLTSIRPSSVTTPMIVGAVYILVGTGAATDPVWIRYIAFLVLGTTAIAIPTAITGVVPIAGNSAFTTL